MLPNYLQKFNESLNEFNNKFPVEEWSFEFRNRLINDYTFFSSRIEDPKLQYGDTIRFLNNETIRISNLKSLTNVNKHQEILNDVIEKINSFTLTEDYIKDIHRTLMEDQCSWDVQFKSELVGNYRNVPTIGSRQPYYEDKEYAPHYNLEIIMASNIDFFNRAFEDIDNNIGEKTLIK